MYKMDLITYFLALMVSFLGVLIGAVLNFIAKEEIKAGKRYFILLKKILLILMVIVFINYLKLNIFLRILLYLLLIILLSLRDSKSYFIYPALGFLFYFSSLDKNLLLTQSSLIFIYGLPCGTLFVEKEKKMLMALTKTILYHIFFMIIPLILFYIFYM